jgi:osmoprotectant transport system permease protein
MQELLSNLWTFFVNYKGEIAKQTVEHLGLTLVSLAIAIVIGVTVGVILTRYKQVANNVIGIAGIIQTIPSVALLGFMLPILGIGVTPAIVALFLYALLPIIRNTFIGIEEVDSSIKEAAKGMGMPNLQILLKVEFPLATPVIFAGIRTATVSNVGVATLCALIASGGLGQFIFRGIALNNTVMILAGAIPAAGLAILLDFLLGIVQKNVTKLIKPILFTSAALASFSLFWVLTFSSPPIFQAGFTSEFMERADGYPGLKKHYDLAFETLELDPGLMYKAIKEKQIDVISGFSTDGRIKAYNLEVLEDDKNYFPPYYAVPVIRGETLRKYPQLKAALGKLTGQISDPTMAELNNLVDEQKQSTKQVAKDFLQKIGLKTSTTKNNQRADIVIGSKNFTEQYILAQMMAIVVENYTNLDVELKTGLAGTQIAFEALKKGDINIYPEYTGTGLLTIIKPGKKIRQAIIQDKDKVFTYVQEESKKLYDVEWLPPFGFNNTYALMMREEDTSKFDIHSISSLKEYLDKFRD